MTRKHIEAPMPGVFYRRSDPDEPVFVEEGESVSEGDTLGLIGVMKNYNDITAPGDGVIAEIVATDEAEVDVGDVLFVLEVQ